MAVDGVHDHRLAGTDLVGHPADQRVASDRDGRVAGEIEVIERKEGIVILVQERREGIDPGRKAFDEGLDQLRRGHRHQRVVAAAGLFGDADFRNEFLAAGRLVKHPGQQVADLIDAGYFSKHAFDLFVFFLGDGQVQDVAVEGPLRHARRHVFHFRPRGMEQHGVQHADFRLNVDFERSILFHLL